MAVHGLKTRDDYKKQQLLDAEAAKERRQQEESQTLHSDIHSAYRGRFNVNIFVKVIFLFIIISLTAFTILLGFMQNKDVSRKVSSVITKYLGK